MESLPPGVVSQNIHINLQATGGQQAYYWSLVSGSLPPGVSFYSGLIDGIPTSSGTFSFIVRLTDAVTTSVTRSLALTVNNKPGLSSPNRLSGNQFQFLLGGGSNQVYILQYSTTLTNWLSFFTNSATTNSFLVIDPNATNKQRFYRALVGP